MIQVVSEKPMKHFQTTLAMKDARALERAAQKRRLSAAGLIRMVVTEWLDTHASDGE